MQRSSLFFFMKTKLPESKLLQGQEWMQTQIYHHPIQSTARANAWSLFTQAHREFENVDFGCEKQDVCKTEQTLPFKRKSLQAFNETAFLVDKQDRLSELLAAWWMDGASCVTTWHPGVPWIYQMGRLTPHFVSATTRVFRECGDINTSVTHSKLFRTAFMVCAYWGRAAALCCLWFVLSECWPTHFVRCEACSIDGISWL